MLEVTQLERVGSCESRAPLSTMISHLGLYLEYQVGVQQSQTTDVPGLVQVQRSVCWVCESGVVLWPECSGSPDG